MKRILLSICFFAFYSLPVHSAQTEYWRAGGVQNGGEKCFTNGQLVSRDYLMSKKCQIEENTYSCSFSLRRKSYICKGQAVAFFSRVGSCPEGHKPDSSGRCEPEDKCSDKKGERLGFVKFPVGTPKVEFVCRNSCQAKTDTWVANGIENDPMPFGLYNYTGSACNGSEGSGGGSG
ncbi:hypothetical protein AB4480_14960, partial [Vibrio sp. 10N.261.45.A4]|uniref:hypothetical protein n=1 Tax=Vibrio sp. 10N.261.45.A4 TaxID=3229655 RepID=UPI00354DEB00